MPHAYDPVVVALTGNLPFILVLSALLTFPVSFALLWLYRRAILQRMNASAKRKKGDFDLPGASLGFDLPVERPLHMIFLNETSQASSPTAEALYTDVRNRPWRTAAIYAGAGIAFALVMATCFLRAGHIALSPLRFLVLFWVYMWPVVLMLQMVVATTWRSKATFLTLYCCIFAILATFAFLLHSKVSVGDFALLWISTNLIPTLCIQTFLSHRIRAVAPLVMIYFIVCITGAMVATSFVGSSTERMHVAAEIGSHFKLGGTGDFIAILLVGFLVFSVPGVLAVWVIRRQYERKELSDQSLALDALWLFFSLVYSIGLVFEGPLWLLSGVGAFYLYKLVARIGFRWFRGAHRLRMRPKLLYLRVFALGRRSERLYEILAAYWRHVGSIQFISGPDLAMTTVQPHHFLDFLVRRVARQFVDGYQALQHHLTRMDVEPDHDGRCRINDFFCHDDTWKMVLTHLVDTSEAVLMDIRGFSPQNAGCVYEINQLVNIMPLERVVFVIDNTTDTSFLGRTVQQAWKEMKLTSPNRRSPSVQMRIFQYTGTGGLYPLLHELCISAENGLVETNNVAVVQRAAALTEWDVS
ncbi:MAG TPA: hypothetical protein VKU00_20815 [Chthonomonadaceae bacterium]|nr:hypothetical protein [Chthonomonadaceae bacterium]